VIAQLSGTLLEKHLQRLVVDVAGVGYEVLVPLSTFYAIGDPGARVGLRIHTHVREDALSLFGFVTRLEQDLFERLIGISGIGPKLAIAVLSGLEPPLLIRAIGQGDVARLTSIPGVGKKTAERIVLELKDRLPGVPAGAGPDGGTAEEPVLLLRDDLLSALINLGYHRPLAEKAVDTAIRSLPGGDFERTLKQALRELAR
jgi:Holliday junction DNA helicase RuvA